MAGGSTAWFVLQLTTNERPISTTVRYALTAGVAETASTHGVHLLISDCYLMLPGRPRRFAHSDGFRLAWIA